MFISNKKQRGPVHDRASGSTMRFSDARGTRAAYYQLCSVSALMRAMKKKKEATMVGVIK